ncbi:uncharacterized protein [Antedon mediterranea]
MLIVSDRLNDELNKSPEYIDKIKKLILNDVTNGSNFVLITINTNNTIFSENSFEQIKVAHEDEEDYEAVAKNSIAIWCRNQSDLSKTSKTVLKAAAVGAVGGVAVATAGPVLLGFGAAGIAAGSPAAAMMSASAIASGGGVAAGGLVATLQSIGAVGLSALGTLFAGIAGATVAGGTAAAVAVATRTTGANVTVTAGSVTAGSVTAEIHIIHAGEDRTLLHKLRDALENEANPDTSCHFRRFYRKDTNIAQTILKDLEDFVASCNENKQNKCMVIVSDRFNNEMNESPEHIDNIKKLLNDVNNTNGSFVLLVMTNNSIFSENRFDKIKVTYYEEKGDEAVAKESIALWF